MTQIRLAFENRPLDELLLLIGLTFRKFDFYARGLGGKATLFVLRTPPLNIDIFWFSLLGDPFFVK